MADAHLPNFFIVGAPKAGTTSLYHHLRGHPDVYMSPMKETSYFADEIRFEKLVPELQAVGRRSSRELRSYLDSPTLDDRFGGIITEWSDYLRLFEQVANEAAIGEATPGYLWSPTAVRKIAKTFPNAKIIMILRNPIERAFSQFLQMSNTGSYALSFDEHIEACLRNRRTDQLSMVYPFLEYGLYGEQVQRYRDAFPPSQIGIWLYEETLVPGFLRAVYEFLGVDGNFVPDTTQRHLEQRIPRIPYVNRLLSRPGVGAGLKRCIPARIRPMVQRAIYRPRRSMAMSSHAREALLAFYREDVLTLGMKLGKDLSHWLERRPI
jgi:hypothetical protein